jgi:hypothetical protein
MRIGVSACVSALAEYVSVLTRRSSAAATGSEADNLLDCRSHKNEDAQRVAVGCSGWLDLFVGNTVGGFQILVNGH